MEDKVMQKGPLPEYLRHCAICDGKGEYEQTYTAGCGGGYYRSIGRCDFCNSTGLRWREEIGRSGPIPASVLNQVAVMSSRPQVPHV